MCGSRPEPVAELLNTNADAKRSRRHWQAVVVLLAVLGAGIVLLATAKYGAGLTTDSVYYLDAARNLAGGKGYVFRTGEPLIWWPPLYPMLLAFVGFVTGLDPSSFAHVVNAILFALLIFLAADLLRTAFQQTTAYSVLGICAMVLSAPLSAVYAMTWSECLFIPLVVLWLVSAQRYRAGHGALALTIMAISAALAGLTRYIGVVLVPAGVLVVLLATGLTLRVRFARASAFAVLSLVPLVFWLLRNYQLAGTLSGDRFHPVFEFGTNTILLAMLMLSWYEPIGLVVKSASGTGLQAVKPVTLSVSLFVALVGICALAATLLLSRLARTRITHSLKTALWYYQPGALFLAAYTAALLLLAARGASSFIDQRLLSPLYVPATLVLLKLAYSLLAREQASRGAFTRKIALVLLALWLCFPLARVLRSTAGRYENGAGGYNTKTWRESGTIAYARHVLSGYDSAQVFANGPDALWELARVDASWIPSRAEVRLNDLEGSWPSGDTSVIVWLKNIHWRRDLLSIEELEKISDVEEVAHFSDGAVYRVSARDTAALD